MVGGEAEPRIRKKQTLADGSVEHNHVTLTQKYKTCFRNPMDLQYYPFDVQFLEIKIATKSIYSRVDWAQGSSRCFPGFKVSSRLV